MKSKTIEAAFWVACGVAIYALGACHGARSEALMSGYCAKE